MNARRLERILDIAGLLLLVCGGGVLAWSWRGLRRMAEEGLSADSAQGTAVVVVEGYARLQTVGFAVAAVGLTVLVLGFVVGRRARAED